MNDDGIELTPDLLDDFYAECEEQLTNLRAQLEILGEPGLPVDRTSKALESLYRSVHSFKGNAAIVGLASAEQLTHVAEGVLRRMSRGEASPDALTIDLLARTTQRLDESVAAFRGGQVLPDTGDLLDEFGRGEPATPGSTGSGTVLAEPTPVAFAEAVDAAGASWRATFHPSAALDARGVNVSSIRARLTDLGTITSAVPTVESGGGIRFDFILSLAEPPADLTTWAADGVSWSPAGNGAPPDDAPAESPPVRAATNPASPSHIVRVDLSRLDELMRIAGEMVIHRSRLHDRIAQLPGDASALQEVNLGLMRSLRDLRAAIMRVRLVPVMEIFSRLPFVVRDLTRGTEKSVRLVLEGQDTEIDKHIVERLKEPLLHLVRNAVSHGIETAAEREAAGKSGQATLRLRASAAGDAVEIRIRDDGRGVDATRVAERARQAGIPLPETLDEPALLRVLCTPGFSTRDEADRAAGRGVGMAVVESTVRELGGLLSLATAPGRFTEFTLRLPLTLSIADVFVVAAGPHRCAVPQSSLDEVIQMPAVDIRPLQGTEVGTYRGAPLPLIRLRRRFGLELPPANDVVVLVLRTDRGSLGLVVDRVIGRREVVVRPMNDPLLRVPGISGATELGDGRPVLILDAATLSSAPASPLRRTDHPFASVAKTA